MKKNERLINIRPYQTSTGDWHLELTYGYEDKKGEHRVIFPDVQCPFPTQEVPFLNTTPRSCGFCGFSIPGLEHIPLNKGTCQLAQERGITESAYAFDIVTEPAIHEMTLDEIEEKLGYKVKIVNKESR